MNKYIARYRAVLVTLMFLASAGAANARDYLIEVVLFETLEGKTATAGGLYYPKVEDSLRLNTDEATDAGFLLTSEGLTLTENAASIDNSGRYRLIRHFAWRQPGLDENSAMPIQVSLGDPINLYLPDSIVPYEDFIPAAAVATQDLSRAVNSTMLNGSIKVRLGRFLHMEVLLVYTDKDTQQSFRLSQSRKMRSRELHYIDNPRFGVLTRILPLEDNSS